MFMLARCTIRHTDSYLLCYFCMVGVMITSCFLIFLLRIFVFALSLPSTVSLPDEALRRLPGVYIKTFSRAIRPSYLQPGTNELLLTSI